MTRNLKINIRKNWRKTGQDRKKRQYERERQEVPPEQEP